MRTGVTRATLRKEILIEAGYSTETGHAVFNEERINQLIARHERMMGVEDEWPGVNFEEQVTVAANAQYSNLPTNLKFTDITNVSVSYGDDWLPVTYGIGARERTAYSATDRAAPIQRWEVVAPGNEQFETWPIASTAQTLLFEGSKALGGFEDDTDTCTLDGDVIVLRVAAQILGRDRKEDAGLMIEMARRLTDDILKSQAATRGQTELGKRPRKPLRPGIDYIAPGSVT